MAENKKGGIGTFVAGAALGVGLGLLFAPKSGAETRKELKEKMDELLQKIKEKLDELVKTAKDKASPVVQKTVDDVKGKTIVVLKDIINKLEKEEDKKNMKKKDTK